MRSLVVLAAFVLAGCATPLTINQVQFVGSHNSYKQAMTPEHMAALRTRNPDAAESLDYEHIPLEEQLDLGLRKLEIDVFYDSAGGGFPVGHVQQIDMNTHCSPLDACLRIIREWSNDNPHHVPIWLSFNAKDQAIEGLPDPDKFDGRAFDQMDVVLEGELADRLIRPRDVRGLNWPTIKDARGKFILILDEGGDKRNTYLENWMDRPMFTTVAEGHPAAAILIINDPLEEGMRIRELVERGYMVRTRADADTREARTGDTRRLQAALASGAQAISTDYYLPADHFGTGFQVRIDGDVRCNPVNTDPGCQFEE